MAGGLAMPRDGVEETLEVGGRLEVLKEASLSTVASLFEAVSGDFSFDAE